MCITQQVFSKLPIIAVCLLFTTSYANFCQLNTEPHIAISEYETSTPKAIQQVDDDFTLLVWSTSSMDSNAPLFKTHLSQPRDNHKALSNNSLIGHGNNWKSQPNCVQNNNRQTTTKI